MLNVPAVFQDTVDSRLHGVHVQYYLPCHQRLRLFTRQCWPTRLVGAYRHWTVCSEQAHVASLFPHWMDVVWGCVVWLWLVDVLWGCVVWPWWGTCEAVLCDLGGCGEDMFCDLSLCSVKIRCVTLVGVVWGCVVWPWWVWSEDVLCDLGGCGVRMCDLGGCGVRMCCVTLVGVVWGCVTLVGVVWEYAVWPGGFDLSCVGLLARCYVIDSGLCCCLPC